MVLPLGRLETVGMATSIADTGLIKNLPSCYKARSKTAFEWAEGYEDGGRHVNRRKFPVMWFDDTQSLPPGRDLAPPYPPFWGWLPAPDFRPFASFDPDHPTMPPRGYQVAVRYVQRLAVLRTAQHERRDRGHEPEVEVVSPRTPSRAAAPGSASLPASCGHAGCGESENPTPVAENGRDAQRRPPLSAHRRSGNVGDQNGDADEEMDGEMDGEIAATPNEQATGRQPSEQIAAMLSDIAKHALARTQQGHWTPGPQDALRTT